MRVPFPEGCAAGAADGLPDVRRCRKRGAGEPSDEAPVRAIDRPGKHDTAALAPQPSRESARTIVSALRNATRSGCVLGARRQRRVGPARACSGLTVRGGSVRAAKSGPTGCMSSHRWRDRQGAIRPFQPRPGALPLDPVFGGREGRIYTEADTGLKRLSVLDRIAIMTAEKHRVGNDAHTSKTS